MVISVNYTDNQKANPSSLQQRYQYFLYENLGEYQ